MKICGLILLAVFGMLLPACAQARPRDDVMSGAYHCAAIADSRQWLDCYYGAAQPVRAQLGLSSALAGQIRLATSPPGGGTASDVSSREEVMAGASRCYAVADDRQWLDCYYGAAQPIRARLGLPPASQASKTQQNDMPVPAGTVPLTSLSPGRIVGGEIPEEQFGLPAAHIATAQKANHIVSYVDSYTVDRYGIFTITLTNGQVWRQLSGDTDYANLKTPTGHYIVTIQRGLLGSYNLTIKGMPGLFRVRRVA